MKEEDELKSKFENEYHKAMVNVLMTGSWLYNVNTSHLKEFNITPEQFNVLRILRGSHPKPMHLADITHRMIDRSSNCTRLLEKLRLKQWVSRELCASNRRQVDISINEKGMKLLTRIDKSIGQLYRQMEGISLREAKELNRLLDKLRE